MLSFPGVAMAVLKPKPATLAMKDTDRDGMPDVLEAEPARLTADPRVSPSA
jgi:hypothetical protein